MFKRIVSAVLLALALILAAAFAGGNAVPRAVAAPLAAAPAVQRINFPPGGTSYALAASLVPGVPQSYLLGISAGQTLYITLSGSVLAQVFDPQGHALAGPSGQPGPWGTAAPATGDYTVTLTGSGPATVVFYIPPFSLPTPWPQPLPGAPTRISFGAGASSATFAANLLPGVPSGYLLRVLAGQQMFVALNGSATAALRDPWGRPVQPAAAGAGQWRFPLWWTGDYELVLQGSGPAGVTVTVPPLQTLPPSATRIRFAPGNASATFTASLPARYVLRILGGQTLYIEVGDENATVTVTGPAGGAVNTVRSGRPGLWVAAGRVSGDYTIAIRGQGATAVTVFVPPL